MEKIDRVIGFTIKVLVIMGIYLIFKEPEVFDKPKENHTDTNIVAYDWENDRNITKAMADTMIFTGGRWYGVSNPPKNRPYTPTEGNTSRDNQRELKWIRPAGSESFYKDNPAMERMWRNSQEIVIPEPITEDDIRDIIVTEFER